MPEKKERSSSAVEMPQKILEGILKVIQPEKIICFGIRSKVAEAWSCFLPVKVREVNTAYDLLILTQPHEKRPRHELFNMLDNFNTQRTQLNALIHNVTTINEAIGRGSLFFTRACNEGLLVYDRHEIPLIRGSEMHNSPETPFGSETLWTKGFGRARKFLAGALHFFNKGWNDLSAFMLHQAVEHTCIALTYAITGYKPSTHNLKRLIMLIDNFAPFGPVFFPCDTREDIYLFHLLSRAYSDARYQEVYWITRKDITILIDRVSNFQSYAENLYREQIPKRLPALKT